MSAFDDVNVVMTEYGHQVVERMELQRKERELAASKREAQELPAPKKEGEETFSKADMDAVYTDRNNAVQLAVKLAMLVERISVGIRKIPVEDARPAYVISGGIRRSTAGDEWPVAVIQLPEGEVAWHIPVEEIILNLDDDLVDATYDGHTGEEKAQRIRAFVV